MKERGLSFSGPMVGANLDGRKTQTRRMRGLNEINKNPEQWYDVHKVMDNIWSFRANGTGDVAKGTVVTVKCPYGVVGDRFYMRETYCTTGVGVGGISYKASGHWKDEGHKWKSGRFMPKILARPERFEITDIRVERVQDISKEDAITEGISGLFTDEEMRKRPELRGSGRHFTNYLWHGLIRQSITIAQADAWPWQYSSYKDNAVGSFSSLWESINAKRGYGWQINPWVWVINYRKL